MPRLCGYTYMTDHQARELTEIIMAYFKVNYKVAKQYKRVF